MQALQAGLGSKPGQLATRARNPWRGHLENRHGREYPMNNQRGEVLSFGPFELSIGNRLLTNGAKVVPLGARAMDLLIVLVEQANKVVGRRTLIERVIRTNFGNQLRLYGRGKTSCPGNKDRGIRNWLLRSVYLTA